jgi:hypothetical protein
MVLMHQTSNTKAMATDGGITMAVPQRVSQLTWMEDAREALIAAERVQGMPFALEVIAAAEEATTALAMSVVTLRAWDLAREVVEARHATPRRVAPAPAVRAIPAVPQQNEGWRLHAQVLYQRRGKQLGWKRLGRGSRATSQLFVIYTDSPSQQHVVRHDEDTGDVLCDCIAASYGKACWHAGEVLDILERDEKVKQQAAASQREWMYNAYQLDQR